MWEALSIKCRHVFMSDIGGVRAALNVQLTLKCAYDIMPSTKRQSTKAPKLLWELQLGEKKKKKKKKVSGLILSECLCWVRLLTIQFRAVFIIEVIMVWDYMRVEQVWRRFKISFVYVHCSLPPSCVRRRIPVRCGMQSPLLSPQSQNHFICMRLKK